MSIEDGEKQPIDKDTEPVDVGESDPKAASPTVLINNDTLEIKASGGQTNQIQPPMRETEKISSILTNADPTKDLKGIRRLAREAAARRAREKNKEGLNPDGTSENLDHNQAMPRVDTEE